MSFNMMGSTGQVRHRLHPPKSETRGPRGIVGKHAKNKYKKTILDATRTFDFAKTRESKGSVFTRALGKVKSIFARGNR